MLGAAGSVARRLANVSPPRVLLPLLLAAPVAVAAPGELAAHVQCQVCGMAVEQARAHASEAGISDEDELSDMLERLCSLKGREGRWLQMLDITSGAPRGLLAELAEAGLARLAGWLELLGLAPLSFLRAVGGAARAAQQVPPRVVPQPQVGECRGECRALHRACVRALKGKEEALVAMLAQSKPASEMREIVCKKSCDGKRLPKLGEWVDEAFVPRNIQDLETEDLIAKMQMESPGISMTSYKKEDMLAMSEGDIETMAAREAYASARQAQQQDDL